MELRFVRACVLAALSAAALFGAAASGAGVESGARTGTQARDGDAARARKVRRAAAPRARVRERVIGRSSAGRRVRAVIFNPRGRRRVLVIGGTHGDEPASIALARELIRSLRRDPPPAGVRIAVVPVLNPDGLAAGKRTNRRGVDINRNLPTRDWQKGARAARYNPGARAASEPETRLLLRLLRRERPDLIISIHAPLACVNWDGDAEPLARVISEANYLPLCPSIGYPTPGSLGTYAGVERGIPTITLELDGARPEDLEDMQVTALRAAVERFARAIAQRKIAHRR